MTDLSTNTNQDSKKQSNSTIRSLSRMAVGGLMLGLDVLSGKQDSPEEPELIDQAQRPKEESVFYDELPDSEEVSLLYRQPRVERSDQDLPYIMTGVMVDTSNRIGRVIKSFDRITGRIGRAVEPVVYPLINNPIVRPFKVRFDRLVVRGEGSIERWKQIGAEEDTKGRELIQTITFSTIDTSIDYVAQQPEVYELATSKTRSLASVILDYVRSIFVSLDIILIGIFAKVLRLSYLLQFEPPSEEIYNGATMRIFGAEEQQESTEYEDRNDTFHGYATGFINRISAFFIDIFFVGIALNIGIWFIRTSAVLLEVYITDFRLLDIELSNLQTISIVGAATFAIYNTLFWTLFGNTIGQAVLGIRVLKKDGELPGPIRSFLRATVGLIIAATLLIVSFLLIVFDKMRRGPHDMLLGTVVVYTWDAHPSQRFLTSYVDKLREMRNGENES